MLAKRNLMSNLTWCFWWKRFITITSTFMRSSKLTLNMTLLTSMRKHKKWIIIKTTFLLLQTLRERKHRFNLFNLSVMILKKRTWKLKKQVLNLIILQMKTSRSIKTSIKKNWNINHSFHKKTKDSLTNLP